MKFLTSYGRVSARWLCYKSTMGLEKIKVMLAFPSKEELHWRETDFSSCQPWALVFNLGKYLFLFRHIMKTIGDTDPASE